MTFEWEYLTGKALFVDYRDDDMVTAIFRRCTVNIPVLFQLGMEHKMDNLQLLENLLLTERRKISRRFFKSHTESVF